MKIEEKYRKLDDIEHVLLRAGMYVGSTVPHSRTSFLFDTNEKYTPQEIVYNPAFLKIFDEIISNSVDEHRRNPKLNQIHVTVDSNKSKITVRDNGGIPVVMHSEYQQWVPEMIFSNLKAGSNFNDDEERLVAGTNGVGSTLTNIFSLMFSVITSDGTNRYSQTFSNNMRDRESASVSPSKESGFTEISFIPDLSRFKGMNEIDETHILLMKKRCVDLAACNPKLVITFNGETFKFPSFKDYCELYSEVIAFDKQERWQVGFGASEGSFTQVSFVNSVETCDGGTHVDLVINTVVEWLREKIRKKHKLDLRPTDIRNHISVFVQSDIVNPAFSSQTKEKLITEAKDFGSKFEPSAALLKKLFESEVVQRILDWADQKKRAEERKQLRALNKGVAKGKVLKLIDAKSRTNREECTISLFEGDSSISAFRKFRDPMMQGGFPLRGKFINVSECTVSRVIQNAEVKDLLTAIGLQMGEEPANLRYGKVLIYADADPDGDSIAGLLINFFGRYWPELFDQERIFRVMTPLVVVEKGKERTSFYTNDEFEQWQSKTKDLKKWNISYKKGLAALEDVDYQEIIQNPRMFSIKGSKNLESVLDTWFSGESGKRKKKILGE
jgi:DNA topoisomerase-2